VSVAVVAEPRPALLARERLELLCDPGTLDAIRSAAASIRMGADARAGDGVVGGIGRVDGRPVACYAHDGTYAGGSLGEAQAETIVRLLELAHQAGMPVVGVIQSAGARMQEGGAALAGFARIFRAMVALSRSVPQIAVVAGATAGGSSYSAALADFVVMTAGASMFLTGPDVVRDALGEVVDCRELGGARVHEENGLCDIAADGDVEALAAARELLSYLPGARAGGAPRPAPAADLAALVPREPRRAYDVRGVIRALADGGTLLELGCRRARNVVTSLCRIDGTAVGLLANQPAHLGGVIDADSAEKAAGFVRTCDAFGLPLVVLVDTPGFLPGTRQERAGVIRRGASLLRAFAAARVPRITVVLRKAFGGAYITMNSRDLGATLTFAWPRARIGVMAAESAVGIIHRRALAAPGADGDLRATLAGDYETRHLDVRVAARDGLVDEVILPEETRARLASGLAALCPRPAAGLAL
jgi:acetyl-CoA carboxylase carboxyltransferase component